MKTAGVLKPLEALGCSPVIVSGGKKMFMKWIGEGLRRGDLRIPDSDALTTWQKLPKLPPKELNEECV
jgi:hypothetical protein